MMMMRLQALLFFVLVLAANAAAQETPAAVIEDSVPKDVVASEQAAPPETASMEGDELEVGEEEEVPIGGTDEDDAVVNDASGGSTAGEGKDLEVGEEVPIGSTDEESSATVDDAAVNDANGGSTTIGDEEAPPTQTGPLIDLFGPALLGLEMIDEQHAQLTANYTSDALRGKKVIGVYFSADWCGPW